MKISVKVYGALVTYVPGRCESQQLEIEGGITAGELVQRLDIPEEEVWLISVFNRKVDGSYQVKEGEELSIFPPVTGG